MRKLLNIVGDTTTAQITLSEKVTDECIVQLAISLSASVSIQARISQDAPWVELTSLATSAIQPLAKVPYLRFVITGNTGVVDIYVSG